MTVEIHVEQALVAARRFGLMVPEAKRILEEVLSAVSEWRKTGRELRLKKSTLDAYASAFEHSLIDEARRVLGK
jgi:hypothetical protein